MEENIKIRAILAEYVEFSSVMHITIWEKDWGKKNSDPFCRFVNINS